MHGIIGGRLVSSGVRDSDSKYLKHWHKNFQWCKSILKSGFGHLVDGENLLNFRLLEFVYCDIHSFYFHVIYYVYNWVTEILFEIFSITPLSLLILFSHIRIQKWNNSWYKGFISTYDFVMFIHMPHMNMYHIY